MLQRLARRLRRRPHSPLGGRSVRAAHRSTCRPTRGSASATGCAAPPVEAPSAHRDHRARVPATRRVTATTATCTAFVADLAGGRARLVRRPRGRRARPDARTGLMEILRAAAAASRRALVDADRLRHPPAAGSWATGSGVAGWGPRSTVGPGRRRVPIWTSDETAAAGCVATDRARFPRSRRRRGARRSLHAGATGRTTRTGSTRASPELGVDVRARASARCERWRVGGRRGRGPGSSGVRRVAAPDERAFDPAVLDGALQLCVLAATSPDGAAPGELLLPLAVERYTVMAAARPASAPRCGSSDATAGGSLVASVRLLDADGAARRRARRRPVRPGRSGRPAPAGVTPGATIYELAWQPAPDARAGAPRPDAPAGAGSCSADGRAGRDPRRAAGRGGRALPARRHRRAIQRGRTGPMGGGARRRRGARRLPRRRRLARRAARPGHRPRVGARCRRCPIDAGTDWLGDGLGPADRAGAGPPSRSLARRSGW